MTEPISHPNSLRAGDSPPSTTLPYERPDEDLRAQEAAAVWRVAWWIGLLWSIGTILANSQTVWTLVSGGWAESRLAELRFGGLGATLSVLRCAGAVALAGAVLANIRRRAVAILASIMVFLMLPSEIVRLMIGGVYFEQSFHLVWLPTIVVRILLDGGVIVVALAALWPGWMTPKRLFASVAVLLLGQPLGQLIDPLYWWLARGEPLGRVVRDQFSWQGWPMMLQAGLLLLVAMLLIVTSSAMRKRRRLLLIAVLVATFAIIFYDLLYLYRAPEVFWNNDPFSQLVYMVLRNLRGAAPVLGLLAWRPVSHA